jgi:hypothetical protein
VLTSDEGAAHRIANNVTPVNSSLICDATSCVGHVIFALASSNDDDVDGLLLTSVFVVVVVVVVVGGEVIVAHDRSSISQIMP